MPPTDGAGVNCIITAQKARGQNGPRLSQADRRPPPAPRERVMITVPRS